MDTAAFNSHTDCFNVLNLVACLHFKTQSSISFWLGRFSKNNASEGAACGWLEVHHPCDEHIKARIRISLPEEYHDSQKLKTIIETTLLALHIPLDETYEADLYNFYMPVFSHVQYVDREGYSDRLDAD